MHSAFIYIVEIRCERARASAIVPAGLRGAADTDTDPRESVARLPRRERRRWNASLYVQREFLVLRAARTVKP